MSIRSLIPGFLSSPHTLAHADAVADALSVACRRDPLVGVESSISEIRRNLPPSLTLLPKCMNLTVLVCVDARSLTPNQLIRVERERERECRAFLSLINSISLHDLCLAHSLTESLPFSLPSCHCTQHEESCGSRRRSFDALKRQVARPWQFQRQVQHRIRERDAVDAQVLLQLLATIPHTETGQDCR